MRHVTLGVALACAGCNALLGIDELSLVDADVTPIDGPPCYGTLAQKCYTSPPTGSVMLSGAIDTATDPRCETFAQVAGPDVCLIAGTTITIDAAGITATGARPLMLVAHETITANGAIDVASRRGVPNGAGANPAVCPAPGTGGNNRHGGGGAGGSFGTRGAVGGVGGGGTGEGGNGGAPALAQVPMFVRGGCPGGNGGNGNLPQPGAGGAGGGAVYLVAAISITVGAGIQASGAGAAATLANSGSCGGGGGGAGGLIALEAPMITVSGPVVANGGGGGEGGGEAAGGGFGENGNVIDMAAGGGNGGGEGGDGGRGSVQTTIPTSGGTGVQGTGQHGGGGGGGGGAGVIWIKGTLDGTTFSPPPMMQ